VVDCYVYVVKSGDALGAIADRYGLGLDEVLARNPSIRDPGLIVRGQEIRLPTPKN
jgi:LysM repeat protein